MSKLLVDYRIGDIATVANRILDYSANNRIFLFYGDMGAGKTTLIKALCECLGTNEPVTSPTFSIVNEYAGNDNKIYHFDFYRLKDQSEALDMGYEEYFYSDAYCFIEWPEKIPALLPEHYIRIQIKVADSNFRDIIIEKI
ncbi:MAG: tRNA threonylcarbamoyladenosine biosynthesis protein TsaE [Mucilaginibacter sp.]|nr:tRNA threonylcarbamoyladenosine biosynthesis protein TsaE [Mucilaginibacter sp.]